MSVAEKPSGIFDSPATAGLVVPVLSEANLEDAIARDDFQFFDSHTHADLINGDSFARVAGTIISGRGDNILHLCVLHGALVCLQRFIGSAHLNGVSISALLSGKNVIGKTPMDLSNHTVNHPRRASDSRRKIHDLLRHLHEVCGVPTHQ